MATGDSWYCSLWHAPHTPVPCGPCTGAPVQASTGLVAAQEPSALQAPPPGPQLPSRAHLGPLQAHRCLLTKRTKWWWGSKEPRPTFSVPTSSQGHCELHIGRHTAGLGTVLGGCGGPSAHPK